MAHAKYADAIAWIAENDDTSFLEVDEGEESIPSVSACLVADLFKKDLSTVISDLQKYMKKEKRK